MTDLTKITTPYGLLDPETRKALRNCGGPWEEYTSNSWVPSGPYFMDAITYRQAPQPVTYPKIQWDHVDDKWQFWARDRNGTGWFYMDRPKANVVMWKAEIAEASRILKLDPGTCDWRDSLVERPK